MSAPEAPRSAVRIRDLRALDLDAVIGIDALRAGARSRPYWERVFREAVGAPSPVPRVALGAETGGALVGYLTGEVRAFEFGSEACGWILAVGVHPGHARAKIASTLLTEACRRFRASGVAAVRTMVRRSDVPMLSLFRSSGFVGGSFVQLELDLTGR